MLEIEKIEELIKSNPEILERFNHDHGDILAELRVRFQHLIAIDDLISRYLLCKALMQTVEIQAKVAKEHIEQKIREQGFNPINTKSKTKH